MVIIMQSLMMFFEKIYNIIIYWYRSNFIINKTLKFDKQFLHDIKIILKNNNIIEPYGFLGNYLILAYNYILFIYGNNKPPQRPEFIGNDLILKAFYVLLNFPIKHGVNNINVTHQINNFVLDQDINTFKNMLIMNSHSIDLTNKLELLFESYKLLKTYFLNIEFQTLIENHNLTNYKCPFIPYPLFRWKHLINNDLNDLTYYPELIQLKIE